MGSKFEQFIKERQYLTNVTPATVGWYRQSLAWLSIESPNEADLKSLVMRMREKGLKPKITGIAAAEPLNSNYPFTIQVEPDGSPWWATSYADLQVDNAELNVLF